MRLWPQIHWWIIPLGVVAGSLIVWLWRIGVEQQQQHQQQQQQQQEAQETMPARIIAAILASPAARSALRVQIDKTAADATSPDEEAQVVQYVAEATIPALVHFPPGAVFRVTNPAAFQQKP